MSSVYLPLYLYLLVGFDLVFCGNILMIYDLPSPSHQLWDYSLAEGLIAKGHNVTMLGPFADREKRSDKYHPLVTEGIIEAMSKNEDFDIEKSLPNISPLRYITVLSDYSITTCKHIYQTKGLRTLLDYPKDFKFDLIIFDLTLTPCSYPLIQKFSYPPTIGMTAFLLPPSISYSFGNPIQPSYLPISFTDCTENMTFFERVLNYICTQLDILNKDYSERNKLEKMAKRVFGEDIDSIESLQKHVSLVLCNLNPAIAYPQPLTPNIIPVGGLHVKEAKALPSDLRTVMDNAKNGVILFSLGTNIRSSNLSPKVKQNLIEAFAKINQTILWKFETELNNLPKNVNIRKWLPQNDILGHPNTKLFISHGGALSTYEAIYHGVPVIGMPFFLDQKVNIKSLVEKKLALRIDVHNFDSDKLLKSINEILTNPIYANTFKEYSRRMRDQPQPPLERAVFWAEYAMRHKGAQFLNPKSRSMSLFVSSSLDVILFLLVVIVACISILYIIFNKIRLYFKSSSMKKQKLS